MKSYPSSVFTELRPSGGNKDVGGGGGVKEVIDALKSYTERHYSRIEELTDESYVMEYTLREMDEISFANGSGDSLGLAMGEDKDFVMT